MLRIERCFWNRGAYFREKGDSLILMNDKSISVFEESSMKKRVEIFSEMCSKEISI